VESRVVTIHVVRTECCPVMTWLEPADGFAWGAADDADNDPGNGLQHKVRAEVHARDGTSVFLFINDEIAAATVVESSEANFGTVEFPAVSDLVVEMRCCDPECPHAITGNLDIEPPECRMPEPAGTEWLSLEHDIDPAGGLQIRVVAASEDALRAELQVDGKTAVASSFSGGEAAFDIVEVADAPPGGRCLRIVCIDEAGNRGFSEERCYGVDSVLPAIEILSTEEGGIFSEEGDVCPSDTCPRDIEGVQICVSVRSDQPTATVELWSGDCAGEPTPLDPEGLPITDDQGEAVGQVSLGTTDGGHDICAGVARPSSNSATDSVSPTLR
jgi:hypothetical protein